MPGKENSGNYNKNSHGDHSFLHRFSVCYLSTSPSGLVIGKRSIKENEQWQRKQ